MPYAPVLFQYTKKAGRRLLFFYGETAQAFTSTFSISAIYMV